MPVGIGFKGLGSTCTPRPYKIVGYDPLIIGSNPVGFWVRGFVRANIKSPLHVHKTQFIAFLWLP